MPRSWTADDIRARGFDPATGARQPYPAAVGDAAATTQAARHRSCAAGASPAPSLSDAARSRLQPEQLLQVETIETIRPKLVAGCKLISINGELPGGSKLFGMWQSIRQCMGYEAGTPDLLALKGRWAHFIELKRPRGGPDLLGHRKHRGELSDVQREWCEWSATYRCPYAVCRSVAEVETAMRKWGMVT